MNGTRTCTRIGSSLIGTLCAVALIAGAAQAQTYPSRPIEFVAQSSPGGGTDLFVRNITELLTKEKSFLAADHHMPTAWAAVGAVAYNYIKSKRGDPHVVHDGRDRRDAERDQSGRSSSCPSASSPRSRCSRRIRR